MKTKEKINNIAIFRIFLCCGVFAFHAYKNMGCDFKFLNNLAMSAVYYMTAFFMLSGLVVGFSNADMKLCDFGEIKSFYRKRMQSIFPLYLLVFIFGIILFVRSFYEIKVLLISLPYQLLGIGNVIQNEFHFNSGTWFFTNIWICYLIFPYVNYLLGMLDNRKIVVVTALLMLLLVDAKLVEAFLSGAGIYRNPILRVIEFSAGVCLARIYINNSKRIKMGGLLSILIFLVDLFAIYITQKTIYQHIVSAPLVFITLCILIRTDSKVINFINDNKLIRFMQKYTLEIWVATFFTTELVNRVIYPHFMPNAHTNIFKVSCCIFINTVIALLLNEYQKVVIKCCYKKQKKA